MGRKSREKRERWEKIERGEIAFPRKEKPEIRLAMIFRAVILVALGLSLFTPLVLSGRFFFPFVGPKSIYFMACVELMFFAWLFLAIASKKYRPKVNILTVVFALYMTVLILSTIFSVDPSRSFWSKYERMTGLLMWFHLFAFFLVISSTIQKRSTWIRVFGISIFVSIFLSLISLVVKMNPSITGSLAGSRGGSTIGNSSFFGTYLLFNIFLAIYLFIKTREPGKVYSAVALFIMIPALILSDARAATISLLGGLILLGLLWMIFCQKGKTRIAAVFLLAVYAIGALSLMYFSLKPGNIVYEKIVAMASKSRLAVWQIGWKGFLEKPLLGWGPENFQLAFYKHYDSRLGLKEFGGEIWFDRAHNIIVDTLVTTGILGIISYVLIFFSAFYILAKNYFKKNIGFWTAGMFVSLLIAYAVQNLTVFDMISSYLMFFLILGYIGSLDQKQEAVFTERSQKIGVRHWFVLAIILALFSYSFSFSVIKPLESDYCIINALKSPPASEQQLSFFKKTLEISPVGKYQIRDFFAKAVFGFLTSGKNRIQSMNYLKEEMDFLIEELQKSTEESPLDFRAYLKLGQLYTTYAVLFDKTKLGEAEKILLHAIKLSPNNQQGYWALSQNLVYQGRFKEAFSWAEKAKDLEPRIEISHKVLIRLAKMMGDDKLVDEKIEEALKINPSWKPDLEEIKKQ